MRKRRIILTISLSFGKKDHRLLGFWIRPILINIIFKSGDLKEQLLIPNFYLGVSCGKAWEPWKNRKSPHMVSKKLSQPSVMEIKLGLFSLLGIIFIVLKLCNVIHWSWWFVLMPFYLGTLILIIILVITVSALIFSGSKIKIRRIKWLEKIKKALLKERVQKRDVVNHRKGSLCYTGKNYNF